MGALFHDLGPKLASLALASVLWFVIAGQKTSEMGLEVPVELQNFPRDLELTGDAVTQVEVRLRASPGIIQQVGKGDVSARIDLAGVSEGERIVHLSAGSIRVPFGVTVVRINPSIITLNFERTLQKVVPVRPRLIGRPAPNHEVAELATDPQEVRIAGPKSRVQEIESAFTEPVSVEGANGNLTELVTIGLEDPVLRIQGSPTVRVTATISEVDETRSFGPLRLEARGGAAVLRPAAVRVVLRGPLSALERVASGALQPYVDLATLSDGMATVALQLDGAPAGVRVERIEPDRVAVRRGGGPRQE
jgi:YbbR domain-containing protein